MNRLTFYLPRTAKGGCNRTITVRAEGEGLVFRPADVVDSSYRPLIISGRGRISAELLMDAAFALATLMKDDMRILLGISAEVTRSTSSSAVTLRITDDRAQEAAKQEVRDRVLAAVGSSAGSTSREEVSRYLDTDWERVRARMADVVRAGFDVPCAIKAPATIRSSAAQLSTLKLMRTHEGFIFCNPFTWFARSQDGSMTPVLNASSSRSRRTFGPAVTFLHELEHSHGWMGPPLAAMSPSSATRANAGSDAERLVETSAVIDVDFHLRFHPDYAERKGYDEVFDLFEYPGGNPRDVDDRAVRYYFTRMREGRRPPMDGVEWVDLVGRSVLETGVIPQGFRML
jgi:hypothetical protein